MTRSWRARPRKRSPGPEAPGRRRRGGPGADRAAVWDFGLCPPRSAEQPDPYPGTALSPGNHKPIRLLDVLRQVYPNAEEAAGILQTTLQNGGPVIHPAFTLLNAALIERTGGAFMFFGGWGTEGVCRRVLGRG